MEENKNLAEQTENQETAEQTPQPRKFRGLYSGVKISVKTLDKVIVLGIAAILIVIFIGLQDRGYTISFDSNGGTSVPSQDHMYGELLEKPEDPTREGYTFDGWYFDESWSEAYDFEHETVYNDLTLEAKWIQN